MKELSCAWSEIDFPLDSEVMALEELMAALRPLELLTKNLCRDHFTALQADTVFQTAFKALRSQQTHIGDRLLAALENRYEERKNSELLSTLRFLTNPLEYEPDGSLLEFMDLRMEVNIVPGEYMIHSYVDECFKDY